MSGLGGFARYTPPQVGLPHKQHLYPDATHVSPHSALSLSRLRSSSRFQSRVAFHARGPEIPPDFLHALPYSALELSSLKAYMRQGEDFVAFCVAHRINFIPVNFQALSGYFYDWIRRGNTARSFGALATKIKWYITNILFGEWIDVNDPVGYKAWLQARRALSKVDPTLVSKKAPLTLKILEKIKSVIPNSSFHIMIFAVFTLQHAAMQRLGELLNGSARLKHIRHLLTPKGPCFIFLYLHSNKPKMHKVKQAPYAVISKRNRPLAYNAISKFLQVFHAKSSSNDYLFPFVTKDNLILGQRPLRSQTAIDALQVLIGKIGLNPNLFGGHSARRGGFCDSLHVPLNFSQTQGHWTLGSLSTMAEYGHQSLSSRLQYF